MLASVLYNNKKLAIKITNPRLAIIGFSFINHKIGQKNNGLTTLFSHYQIPTLSNYLIDPLSNLKNYVY